MKPDLIIELIVPAVLIIQFIIIAILFAKSRDLRESVLEKSGEYTLRLDKTEAGIRDEFSKNRDETNKSAKEAREELSLSLKSVSEQLSAQITNFTGLVDNKIKSILDSVASSSKTSREELAAALKLFEEKFSARIESLTKDTKEGLEKNRDTVEKKLADIQKQNGEKLEQMRQTVDEKLHKTLETRLGESFKLVSERLELVHKGLGEMQSLASDVGSLKNVLSNVKTKGVLGEYQLGAILEQMLTPNQYAQNVKTKEGCRDNVEFAIIIPGREDSQKSIWLPVDSKFPTVDYETLTIAYEAGDTGAISAAQKNLEAKVKKFAKDIHDKYIDPPNTTEFAIMFLPFEGLYAEVLRIPGLFASIQNDYKVTITGPTTVSAFLNSLQMGFRSLAVERRTSEIWDLLGAIRTEFGKFGEVLQKTKEKLDSASREIDRAGTRSRAIERKLRDVQTIPEAATQKLLGDIISDYEDSCEPDELL